MRNKRPVVPPSAGLHSRSIEGPEAETGGLVLPVSAFNTTFNFRPAPSITGPMSLYSTITRAPTVSAIVVAPPAPRRLGDAVAGVLDQDYPRERLEVLVIDGGAGDAPGAIDRAVAQARGELIALKHAEDEWLPDKLRRQVAVLAARPEVGLVFGDMAVIGDDGSELCDSYWAASGIAPQRGRPLGALMRGNFVPAGTIVVRTSLRERFAPLSAHPGCEDWWIAARVAEVAEIDYVTGPVLRFCPTGRNLGLAGPGRAVVRDELHELPLRRWLLTRLTGGAVAPVDLLASCERFEHSVHAAADERGLPPSGVVPVSEHDAAMATSAVRLGRSALRGGDLAAAARAAARACGFHPQREDVRRLLDSVRAVVAHEGDVDRRRVAFTSDAGQPGLRLRSFVTLALADELVGAPDLLRSYADTFAEDDDASLLMVLTTATPSAVHGLAGAVVAAGLDSHEGPDLVATAVGGPVPSALVHRAAALLSPHEQQGPLSDLPRVDGSSVSQLRVWMERRP